MNKQQKQRFKEILQKGNFRPYRKGKNVRDALERACLDAIAQNSGALFYRDLTEPLSEHLGYLYNSGQIIKKVNRWSSWVNRDYEQNNFERKPLSEVQTKLEELAKLHLEKLSFSQPNSFRADLVYDLLKRQFNLTDEDKLVLKPLTIETPEQAIKIMQISDMLRQKSFGHSPEPNKDLVDYNQVWGMQQFRDTGKIDRMLSEGINGTYKSALGNARVAYTSLDAALVLISPYLTTQPRIGRTIVYDLKIYNGVNRQ